MTRIRFEDLPSTNTPRNAENLNKLNNVVISPTEPTTGEEVWIQKGKNLFDIKTLRTWSQAGLTFTPNVVNNSIDVTGTATGYSEYVLLEKFVPKHNFIISLNGQLKNASNLQVQTIFYKDGAEVDTISNVYSYDISTIDFDYCRISLKRSSNIETNISVKVLVSYATDPSFEPYIEKKIYIKNDNGVYEEFYDENNLDVYSTSEHRIGTWIDGKPLYSMVIDLPNGISATNNGTKEYTLNELGIYNAKHIHITHPSYYSYNGLNIPFNYNDGNAFQVQVGVSKLVINVGYAPIRTCPMLVTLEYTKTTD